MNLATNTLLTENSQIQEEIDTFIPVKRPTTHILIFKKSKTLRSWTIYFQTSELMG